jgi:uncharacterized protein (DUF1800 family)
MRESVESAIAANRFGLGARPGELADIAREPRAWLTAQLSGGAVQPADATLRNSAGILAEALEIRRDRAQARAGAAPQTVEVMKLGELYRPLYVAETTARWRTAVLTERPLVERLTHFWSNHFAVSVDKPLVLGIAGSFEREAIRPHVLGSFTDMLLAVEQHPAMLLYLDNQRSIGAHSPAAMRVARRRPDVRIGINENLAREIMELHTLGVNGGYSQADVTTFANVISGWSVGGGAGRLAAGEPGRFVFREELHEPGPKVVLGRRYPQEGQAQGEAVLRDLAHHPATAQHIATKLARHFIADEPPPQAVERLARAFHGSGGDLRSVYLALIDLPEPWAQPLSKFKTPSEYVVSTYRGLALPLPEGRGAFGAIEMLGQRTYAPGSPAGWPDRSADWDGAASLLKRLEWADAVSQRVGGRQNALELGPSLLGGTLAEATRAALAHAATAAQSLTLLLAAPEFMRR